MFFWTADSRSEGDLLILYRLRLRSAIVSGGASLPKLRQDVMQRGPLIILFSSSEKYKLLPIHCPKMDFLSSCLHFVNLF